MDKVNLDIPKADKRQVILMLSQTCNKSCKYCYQTYKQPGLMPVETAILVLSRELKVINDDPLTSSAEIAFLGGEPLLNFETLKTVSEWLFSYSSSKPIELTVRTNGSLLNQNMKSWFLKYKHRIQLGLSMDGLSEMNDYNRSSSNIDWRFFCDNWPKQRVNVVLFCDSIKYLTKTVLEMREHNIRFKLHVGEGFHWSIEKAKTLEEQLYELITYYLDEPQEAIDSGIFPCRLSDYYPDYPILSAPFCGISNNIIAYNSDGSPCICHLFTTPSIGNKQSRITWEELRNIPPVPMDSECICCPVQKNCKNCFGQNLKVCGSIYKSAARVTICEAIKAMARASALFKLKVIEHNITKGHELSMFDKEDATKALRYLRESTQALE